MHSVQKIELAIHLVMTSFAGMTRTGPTPVPSSTHSLRVGLSLIAYGYSLEVCIAGFCHDLVEDTDVTLITIERLFNPRVRHLVAACSFDPNMEESAGEEDLNRRVLARADDGDPDPLRIKCADIVDNLKTNSYLQHSHQISLYQAGLLRFGGAQKHFPNETLAHDLAVILGRERTRLAI